MLKNEIMEMQQEPLVEMLAASKLLMAGSALAEAPLQEMTALNDQQANIRTTLPIQLPE